MKVAQDTRNMARRRRIFNPGSAYHVLNRSAKRAALFQSRDDYCAFERLLIEAGAHHPMRILAYCLMPSHWHLLLWPKTGQDLARHVKWVTATHAARWNRAHDNVGGGAVYQARYKSVPIEEGSHLL